MKHVTFVFSSSDRWEREMPLLATWLFHHHALVCRGNLLPRCCWSLIATVWEREPGSSQALQALISSLALNTPDHNVTSFLDAKRNLGLYLSNISESPGTMLKVIRGLNMLKVSARIRTTFRWSVIKYSTIVKSKCWKTAPPFYMLYVSRQISLITFIRFYLSCTSWEIHCNNMDTSLKQYSPVVIINEYKITTRTGTR